MGTKKAVLIIWIVVFIYALLLLGVGRLKEYRLGSQGSKFVQLTDRIDIAITEFVARNGAIQHYISLPEKEFQELRDYANSTALGRDFAKGGLCYCTLPVTINTGTEILICPKVVWE